MMTKALKKKRHGYAQGGNVKPDTWVTGDDAAKQVQERYKSAMEQVNPRSDDYARGGMVRRKGYAGGGEAIGTGPGYGFVGTQEKTVSTPGGGTKTTKTGPTLGSGPGGKDMAMDMNMGMGMDMNMDMNMAKGGVVRKNFQRGGPTISNGVGGAREGSGPSMMYGVGGAHAGSGPSVMYGGEVGGYRRGGRVRHPQGQMQQQPVQSIDTDRESRDPFSNFPGGVQQGYNAAVGGMPDASGNFASRGPQLDASGTFSQPMAGGGIVRQNFRRGGSAGGPMGMDWDTYAMTHGLTVDEHHAYNAWKRQQEQEAVDTLPPHYTYIGGEPARGSTIYGAGQSPAEKAQAEKERRQAEQDKRQQDADERARKAEERAKESHDWQRQDREDRQQKLIQQQKSSNEPPGPGGRRISSLDATPQSTQTADAGGTSMTADTSGGGTNPDAGTTTIRTPGATVNVGSGSQMAAAYDGGGGGGGSEDEMYAAEGGYVPRRRGYADGGGVDDPTGAVIPDYSNQAEERRIAEERARAEAAQAEAQRQAAADAQQKATEAKQQAVTEREASARANTSAIYQSDVAAKDAAAQRQAEIEREAGGDARQPVGQTEQARQAEVGRQQVEAGQQPQPTQGATQPWHHQVYDYLLNSLGEFKKGFNQEMGAGQGYFDPRRDAAPPEAGLSPLQAQAKDALTPYNYLKSSADAPSPVGDWIDAQKDKITGFLHGKGGLSPDQLAQMHAKDPTRNLDQHLQTAWDTHELNGNKEGAGQILQTIRGGMNHDLGVARAAFDKGDTDTGLTMGTRALNNMPDRIQYDPVRDPNTGQYGIRVTPQRPGMGEGTVLWGSPAQLRDFINNINPDNIMQHGAVNIFNAQTGKAKPVDVPAAREPAGYSGVRTDSGYPIDSAAGKMELGERAMQRGLSGKEDRDAIAYVEQARAAVRGGIPPDQVHDWLRQGGDPSKLPQREAPAQPITRDAQGRLVYDPIYDIPGSSSPVARNIPTPGLTARAEEFDANGRYVGRGTSDATDFSARRRGGGGGGGQQQAAAAAPPPPTSQAGAAGMTPATGYTYGERRAGYRAPATGADVESPSWKNEQLGQFNMPPAPGGPGAAPRDVFEEMRGGTRFDLNKAPTGTEGRQEYNERLRQLQEQTRPLTGSTAYDARNRQLNEASGYGAYQDRQAVAQKQAIADADRRYQEELAGRNKITERYGYYTPELAERERAGAPMPIYRDDYGRLRRPTQQEQAQDIATSRQLELQRTKDEWRERPEERLLRDLTVTGAKQAGAMEKARYTEGEKNQRNTQVLSQRDRHLDYLTNKANQDRIARTESGETQARIRVLTSKLANDPKSITPEELDAYQGVVERGLQQPQQQQAAPAAAQGGAPDPATYRGDTPPGQAPQGQKWQRNQQTGLWRLIPAQ